MSVENELAKFDIYPFEYIETELGTKEGAITKAKNVFGNFTFYGERNNDNSNFKEVIKIPNQIENNSVQYTVVKINHSVFDHCERLEKLIVSPSVRKIDWGFWKCFNLASIEVDKDNPHYCSCDGVLFDKNRKTLIAYPNAKGSKYKIPDRVRKLNNKSFKGCIDLQELTLPDTITHIGANAFYGCMKLKEVILPDSLQKFGGYKGELSYLPPTIFKYKGKDYKINELAEIFGNQETRKKQ